VQLTEEEMLNFRVLADATERCTGRYVTLPFDFVMPQAIEALVPYRPYKPAPRSTTLRMTHSAKSAAAISLLKQHLGLTNSED
jgi:hypothetical protein